MTYHPRRDKSCVRLQRLVERVTLLNKLRHSCKAIGSPTDSISTEKWLSKNRQMNQSFVALVEF
jgi:hypothetical protein